MVWNHRVIRHEKDGETWYAIHKCFYDDTKDDTTISWTVDEIAPIGEDLHGLRVTLERMLAALDKPVLVIQGDRVARESPQ